MPSDKNSGLLVKEPHMTNLMGKPEAVVSESDMENSAAHKDLSVINFDEINKVIHADNKESTWAEYRKGAAKRIWNCSVSVLYVKYLKDRNTETTFIKFISEHGFPVLKGAEEIVNYMNDKLKLFKGIVGRYKDELDNNYTKYGLTKAEAIKLLKDIKNDKFAHISSRIYNKLNARSKDWKRNWGADFKAFGGGLVFMNPDENIWEYSRNVETLFNLAQTYDIVVYCHGTNITPGHHLSEAEYSLAEKIDKMMQTKETKKVSVAVQELEDSLTQDEKAILKKYSDKKLMRYYKVQSGELERYYYNDFLYIRDRIRGDLRKQWGFGSPLKTPYGVFRDVNEFCRECVRRGHKKIKIMSCNPGHYKIAKDLLNMKDIDIDYQVYSIFVESTADAMYENLLNNMYCAINEACKANEACVSCESADGVGLPEESKTEEQKRKVSEESYKIRKIAYQKVKKHISDASIKGVVNNYLKANEINDYFYAHYKSNQTLIVADIDIDYTKGDDEKYKEVKTAIYKLIKEINKDIAYENCKVTVFWLNVMEGLRYTGTINMHMYKTN